MEVFLGGTCNDSKWREELIPLLNIDYFNPVVEDWNEEAQEEEIYKRETCDFILYVVTPLMEGFYSIVEMTDDSNKSPERTVVCFLTEDGDKTWTRHQQKSIEATKALLEGNGAVVLDSLEEVAYLLNNVEE
jgi:hypothetical protein